MVFSVAYQNRLKNTYLIISSIFLGLSFWFKEPFIFVFITLYIINIRLIKINKSKIIYTLSAILPSFFGSIISHYISRVYVSGLRFGAISISTTHAATFKAAFGLRLVVDISSYPCIY
jgi:hypothetical protein